MSDADIKRYYEERYAAHMENREVCTNAIHDIEKARSRVAAVVSAHAVGNLKGKNVLDVGSGLGYYTKALALAGANVLGLDFSEAATASAQVSFPGCRFQCGSWPDDVQEDAGYDLIWMVNFSLANTFDVARIDESLIAAAMSRLAPGGALILGWTTDFSGRVIEGYSHWPMAMLRELERRCNLSAPLVPIPAARLLSPLLIRYATARQRSIPIFMIGRALP